MKQHTVIIRPWELSFKTTQNPHFQCGSHRLALPHEAAQGATTSVLLQGDLATEEAHYVEVRVLQVTRRESNMVPSDEGSPQHGPRTGRPVDRASVLHDTSSAAPGDPNLAYEVRRQ
ncbi:hypothetical protein C8Q76DRAFT_182814 [Earliella scabrosa]|nr:hypothetical protein C8Q76DRAFT_182814 [Earliella scabrosa]